MNPTALIAEDEPLLAQALKAELAAAWPQLQVLATAGDGRSAVREALRLLPQVLFFDIRMPGLDGLGAAAELADRWPVDEAPMPQLVFVTAYDEYAARAFETQAIDYVLKPVQPERLRKTVLRLQQALAAQLRVKPAPAAADEALERTLAQWRQVLAAAAGNGGSAPPAASTAPLKMIAASEAGGSTVRMVPIDEVLYFEAADKYIRVLTATNEYLIRTPLKQLLAQLDPEIFWQVHRAVVVRSSAIEAVHRDEAGKLHLDLRGRPEKSPSAGSTATCFAPCEIAGAAFAHKKADPGRSAFSSGGCLPPAEPLSASGDGRGSSRADRSSAAVRSTPAARSTPGPGGSRPAAADGSTRAAARRNTPARGPYRPAPGSRPERPHPRQPLAGPRRPTSSRRHGHWPRWPQTMHRLPRHPRRPI